MTEKRKELARLAGWPSHWADTGVLRTTKDFDEDVVSYLEDLGLVEDLSYYDDDGDKVVEFNILDKEGLKKWCEEYDIEYLL